MADQVKLNAMKETLKSSELTPEERQKLEASIKNDRTFSMVAKGVLVAGFVLIPNWKVQTPIYKRHIPLAVVAVLGCSAIDHFVRDYFWSQNEAVVKRVTGYNGEIYINP